MNAIGVKVVAAVVLALTFGCGSTPAGSDAGSVGGGGAMLVGGGSGSNGGGSGTGGGSATGGGSGGGSGALSLLGTWDVTLTEDGNMRGSTVLVVGPGSFVISQPYQLTVTQNGSAIAFDFVDSHTNSAGQANQTSQGFDTGAIPFAFGGSWTITSQADSSFHCSASIAPTALIGSNCSNLSDTVTGNFTLTRNSTNASSFGDFGGVWTGTDVGGASTTLTVSGNDFSFAVVSNDSQLNGVNEVHFPQDGVFTASAAHGWEALGIRRK